MVQRAWRADGLRRAEAGLATPERAEPACIVKMVPVKYEVGRAEHHEGEGCLVDSSEDRTVKLL